MRLCFRPAAISVAIATQTFVPNNANISVSDFAGLITQNSSQLRLVRAIDSGVGDSYKYTTPAARIRFGVILTSLSEVKLNLNFTGLVTRTDSYNPNGSIYIDGSPVADFAGPSAWTISTPHPIGNISISLAVPAGSHTIELFLPYDASLDLINVMLPAAGAMATPTARTTQKCIFVGDSIEHGYNSTKIRNHWTTLLCDSKGWQQINLGYGGRVISSADFTIVANAAVAQGAQRVITNYGINDCFAGASAAAIQASVTASINAFRAVSATIPLYWINLFDCTNPALITAPSTARTAIQAAFTAVGGVNDHLIPGGTAGGLPSSTLFADLTHPGDLQSPTVASVLGGLVS